MLLKKVASVHEGDVASPFCHPFSDVVIEIVADIYEKEMLVSRSSSGKKSRGRVTI